MKNPLRSLTVLLALLAGLAAFAVTVKKLATADSPVAARGAFKALSRRAIHLAEGREGYHVAHCPMVSKDEGYWVQITKAISNPYFGKAMLICGSIK